MHKLPVRRRNGTWEVLVPLDSTEKWIVCDNESDALLMADSSNLAFEAVEGTRLGEEIATELEGCARIFFGYGCHERALWLAEHAKLARGEPSIFGGKC